MVSPNNPIISRLRNTLISMECDPRYIKGEQHAVDAVCAHREVIRAYDVHNGMVDALELAKKRMLAKDSRPQYGDLQTVMLALKYANI